MLFKVDWNIFWRSQFLPGCRSSFRLRFNMDVEVKPAGLWIFSWRVIASGLDPGLRLNFNWICDLILQTIRNVWSKHNLSPSHKLLHVFRLPTSCVAGAGVVPLVLLEMVETVVAARLWVGRGSRPSVVLLFQCSEIGLARVSSLWCCVVISRGFECVSVCAGVCLSYGARETPKDGSVWSPKCSWERWCHGVDVEGSNGTEIRKMALVCVLCPTSLSLFCSSLFRPWLHSHSVRFFEE